MLDPTEAMSHPGYLLVNNWELEIIFPKQGGGRVENEKITLSMNSFNLPERSSRTFEIINGPGAPPTTYSGPPNVFDFTLDFTNFYEKKLVQFFIEWHERAYIHYLKNVHDGYVVGYDDERIIRYKADVYGMWPYKVSLGDMSRDITRQHLSVSLAVYDIIHDFNFEKFQFEEGCL